MRILYVSGVDFGLRCLEYLIDSGIMIDGVISYSPKKRRFYSDCADFLPLCEAHRIPCLAVDHINDAPSKAFIHDINPDLILVMGWSQIIDDEILAIPKWGVVGSHPTLLPKYRGRASLPWTILKKLKETGLTFFHLTSGTDTGDIVLQRRFDIGSQESATVLYEKITAFGKEMLMELIYKLERGQMPRRSQDESDFVEYWKKRTPKNGRIDWNQTADDIETLVRATSLPYPGAYTMWNGQKMIIWNAFQTQAQESIADPPGTILALSTHGVIVKCGVGELLITRMSIAEDKKRRVFKTPDKSPPAECLEQSDVGGRFT